MAKVLKNTTASPIDLTKFGVQIPATTDYTVPPQDFLLLSMPTVISEITTYINSGSIVVNDGSIDLSASNGIEYLKYPEFAKSIRFDTSSNGFDPSIVTAKDAIENMGVRLQMTSQATANSTLTLTSTSNLLQVFTGTTSGQIVKLPDATTLVRVGYRFEFWNMSNQSVNIQDNGGASLLVLGPNTGTWAVLSSKASSSGTWILSPKSVGTNPQYYTVTGSSNVTTTSSTYSLVSGMSITPAVGTYLAMFTGTFRIADNNADGDFAIFKAGSIVQDSNRRMFTTVSVLLGLINNSIGASGTPVTVVTVDGTQAIEGRFRATNGTMAVNDRNLTLVRIA